MLLYYSQYQISEPHSTWYIFKSPQLKFQRGVECTVSKVRKMSALCSQIQNILQHKMNYVGWFFGRTLTYNGMLGKFCLF